MDQKTTSLSELVMATQNNLMEFNYSKSTLAQFNTVWKRLAEFTNQKGYSSYTPVVGLDFLHQYIGYPFIPNKKLCAREKWHIRGIRLLNDYQEHKTISAKLLPNKISWENKWLSLRKDFEDYSYDNNHSRGTVCAQLQAVDRFLKLSVINKGIQLNELTPRIISEFIAGLTEYSKSAVKIKLVALRFFFKFLYEKEYIPNNLSGCIPYVQGAKSERVPSTLGDGEIQKLLGVVDRGSPIGKRNYAILVIAALLGIRDSDIANLTFENLDWGKNRIEFVQSKTGEPLCLPLLPAVGEAIIDYLKHGRPITKCNHIFVKHKAPFGRVTTFYEVMAKSMNDAGIKTHVNALRGLHVLRHTLASGLIKQGEAYNTVSAVLGHVHSGSADVYTHIDINGLLRCALEKSEVTAYV